MDAIKVYRLDDCEWWAGESLEACIAAARAECGSDCYEDAETQARELTPEQMESCTYYALDEIGEPQRTFAEQLAIEIAAGTKFPCLFASTEY